MGGYGSTRWAWHNKKDTVEDCWVLSIFDLKSEGVLEPDARRSGSWVWRNAYTGEKRATVGYELNTLDSFAYLRLDYTITKWEGSKQEFDYRIRLVTTPCNMGGARWWFICPLSVNGRLCGRRVAKLYLPLGGSYFGCRHCYDLTYRSSQESDKRLAKYRRLDPLEILHAANNGDIDLLTALKVLPDWVWRR